MQQNTKIIIKIYFACVFIILSACDSDNFYRTRKLMKGGKLLNNITKPYILNPLTAFNNSDSLESFVYSVHVNFPNDTTNYNFLVDVGSPTVISEQLAKKLQIEILYNFKDYSFENHPNFDIGIIPSLKIQELSWQNIAVIIDKKIGDNFFCHSELVGATFRKNLTLSSQKINNSDSCEMSHQQAQNDKFKISLPKLHGNNYDGIIGANLMQHAIWQFKWCGKRQSKQIILHIQKPDLQGYTSFPFVRNLYRIPKFHAFFNHFKQKQIFHLSTGFAKGVKIPIVEWQRSAWLGFDSLHANCKMYQDVGFDNFLIQKEKNAFQPQKDTIYEVMMPLLRLDTVKIHNLPTIFGQGNAWHVGNAFWKQFDLLIDWNERKFYLKKL